MMSDQPVGTEEQRLKRRSMRRLAVALALIALAIVALALLDRYSSSPKPTAAPASPPVEPPPIATLPKPIQPAPTPLQSGVPSATQSVPRLPPPPPPLVSNEPLAPVERTAPAKSIPGPTSQAADIVPESTGGASRAPAKPASKPAEEKTLAPAASKPTPNAAPTSGYVVQLGVFTSVEHAQSLQAKLKEQGIPTTLETRVIVGPFHDRAEADAAQKKLNALGVSGLVAQRK